jgi:signal transduction histidine kinase
MPLRHPTPPCTGVGLFAVSLLMGAVLLSSHGPGEGGAWVPGLMLGLGGLLVGSALGWRLRRPPQSPPPPELLALSQENARLRAQIQGAFELVGVAAHDLGNPLLALQLRLHRLRTQLPPESRFQEGLSTAERETRRMGLLVHELLDLSRLSAGRLSLKLEELDLTALAREVAERFTDQAAAVGSPVVVHAPQQPVRVWWDRQRLDRVTTNLLSNAIKFGQGQPIEVYVQGNGPHARLVVRDHGMGLPPEAHGRIFGRFERVSGTGRPGTGLGLYIVRQLVEAHGGTIQVSSHPGDGATFTVELPQARA